MIDRPIVEVRLFEGLAARSVLVPQELGTLYKSSVEMHTLARRLSRKAGELGFTIGKQTHLYLTLVPDLEPGSIQPIPYSLLPWYREVLCGADLGINAFDNDSRVYWVRDAILNTFRLSKPSQTELVDCLDNFENLLGNKLRICVKSFETDRFLARLEQTVEGSESTLWLSLENKSTERKVDLKLSELQLDSDPMECVKSIVITKNQVKISPKNSARGLDLGSFYNLPMVIAIPPSLLQET